MFIVLLPEKFFGYACIAGLHARRCLIATSWLN